MSCVVCDAPYRSTPRVRSLMYSLMDYPDGKEFNKQELKVRCVHTCSTLPSLPAHSWHPWHCPITGSDHELCLQQPPP